MNIANKNQYFDIIYSVTDKVYQSEVKQNTNSLLKVQHNSDSRSSRTVYRVDADADNEILIVNQNNPAEYVKFSGKESSLSSITGAASLTVQFDAQDKN